MGKYNGWKKSRKVGTRELPGDYIYIFTEGEQTEPNYFKSFKKIIEHDGAYRNKINIKLLPCHKGTVKLVEEAQKYLQSNKITKGQVWLVYDKDDFTDFDYVPALAEKQSTKDITFHTAWSNQSFELWFILHFDNYQTDNPRTEYIKFLDKKFYSLKLGNYEKNRTDIFDVLLNDGNPKQAIKFSKTQIQKNKNKNPSEIAPGTTVFMLVEELAKYLPEDIKEKFIIL